MTPTHRLGQEPRCESPRDARLNRAREEEPGVAPIARSRPLDRWIDAGLPAGISERSDIGLPIALVEVDGQEPARIVREEWIETDNMSTLEVVEDDFVGHGKKRLARAFAALDSRLLADARDPFVCAGWRVTLDPGPRVPPMPREDVHAPPEERAK